MKFAYLFVGILFLPFVYAAPFFIDYPKSPQNVTEGYLFSFDVNASNEGVRTSYSLIFVGCSNCFAIDSVTGLINYIPNAAVGSFDVVIVALDTIDFSLNSTAVKFNVTRLPYFNPGLVNHIVLNMSGFFYDINASDPDNDTLIFSDNNPLFDINNNSGFINLLVSDLNVLISSGNNPTTTNVIVNDSARKRGFPSDGVTSGTFILTINDPVYFNPIPANFTLEDSRYVLNVSLYVINYIGILTFSTNVSFISINPSTGIIDFIPDNNTVGNYTINLSVRDQYGASSSIIWPFNITFVNDPPLCPPIGSQSVRVGSYFTYDYNATDEEGPVNYSDNAVFFDINETTGIISFLASPSLVGSIPITLTVSDNGGKQCNASFLLTVLKNNVPLFPKNRTLGIYPLVDLYVDSNSPNLNFGGNFIEVSTVGGIKTGYLKFNLGSLSGPSALLSASLNLTIQGATDNFSVSLHNVSLEWNMSISYLTQPDLGLPEVSVATSAGIFPLTSLVALWFNDVMLNRSVALNLSREGVGHSVFYISMDSGISAAWPVLSVIYLLNISNYNWTTGSTLLTVFDLDDYFYDVDGDNLTYTFNGTTNVVVNIDKDNKVSFSSVHGFVGAEYVQFIANDTLDIAYSNVVTLTVEKPPEFQTQEVQTSSSSSSISTRIKKKVASIGIIFDVQRKTVERGKSIEVPVKIKNTGEVPLSAVDLGLLIDKTDLKGLLTLDYIDSLAIGAEENIKLLIDTRKAEQSRYIISLNAHSADIEESSVFILDVLREGGETINQLEIAKQLFKDNPECLEFQEVVIRAEEQLRNNELEKAQTNIASAIEGCKSLIRELEKPELIKKKYDLLLTVLMISLVVTLTFIVLFLVYKSISYRFKEE